jgi:hypothetical protein
MVNLHYIQRRPQMRVDGAVNQNPRPGPRLPQGRLQFVNGSMTARLNRDINSLPSQHAPVDADVCAGYIGGIIAGKERHYARHLLGLAHPIHHGAA